MSTNPPGGPRRRRIAGERRGRTIGEDQPLAPAEDAPPADRPVLTEKARQPSSGSTAASSAAATSTGSPTWDDTHDTRDVRDGTTGEVRSEPSGGWWGSWASILTLTAVLLTIVLLSMLAALGVLTWLVKDGIADRNEAEATERSIRTAPAAAEAAAEAILAYDFRSLDADQDTAARFMTEDFAEEYADTFEKVVRPAAEKTRAKVTASVLASSVVLAGEDTARILLFVDQATTSTANERPQMALNRVEMSMERDGDSWLVSDISSY
jgi:Mce-associated membrane protein